MKKAKHYVLAALFFSVPLLPKATTLLTILFVIGVLVVDRGENFGAVLRRKRLWPYILVYLMLMFGLVYTIDLKAGWLKVQTQASLLVFPLFLGGATWMAKRRSFYLNCFVFGVFLTAVLCFVNVGYRYGITDSWYTLDSFSRRQSIFSYTEFSRFLDLHPTYFSLYLGLALFYLIYTFEANRQIASFLKVLVIALLFLTLFLTSSKAGIFSFLLLTASYLVYKAILEKSKKHLLAVALSIVGGIALFATNPILLNRSLQAFDSMEGILSQEAQGNESTGIRYNLWRLSAETINRSPLYGYGTGSVREILDENCIEFFEFSTCETMRHNNSHNQYLNFLVSNGLLTFIPFVLALLLGLHLAISRRDMIFLFFMTFLMLNFCFESLLERERGVVFFALFVALFHSSYQLPQTEKEDHVS